MLTANPPIPPQAALSERALRRRALAGALAAAPAAYFVSASVLKFTFGMDTLYDPIETMTATRESQRLFNAVTPYLFIGGLAVGWVLNISPLVRWRAKGTLGGPVGRLRVHLHPFNLVVAAVSAGTLGVLMMYLSSEALLHLIR